MKTTISIMALVIGLGLNLNAQTTAQKGTYIKIDIKENGKETKIDTCFSTSMSDSIKKMFMNVNWDSLPMKTDGNGKVVVKTIGNGNSNSIIITEEDGDLKDSKGNAFKVYVLKKVEIVEITDEDKKELPSDVTGTLNNSKPFSNLVMAPNPTEGNVRITYKSTSTEPLTIKAYDSYGHVVLTQNYEGLDNDVDKTVSLNNLSKGIYFVQLVQGNQSEVRKIIVN